MSGNWRCYGGSRAAQFLLRTSGSLASTLPIWVSINPVPAVLTKIGRRDSEDLRSKLSLLDDLRASKISHDSLRKSPEPRSMASMSLGSDTRNPCIQYSEIHLAILMLNGR